MYRLDGRLFKLMLLKSWICFLVQFIYTSCPFLILEHLQKLVFKEYSMSLLLLNIYRYLIDVILFQNFDSSSIGNTASWPQFCELNEHYGGGNISRIVSSALLNSKLIHCGKHERVKLHGRYRFVKYVLNVKLAKQYMNNNHYVICRFALIEVANWLSISDVYIIAEKHNIKLSPLVNHTEIEKALTNHVCDSCFYHACIFEKIIKNCDNIKNITSTTITPLPSSCFPPSPVSKEIAERIINGFCVDSEPKVIQEAGCAICGRLSRVSELFPLHNYRDYLDILSVKGVTRQERKSVLDPINDINGPILDKKCSHICSSCAASIQRNIIPLNALANGLWIGDVPPQLQNLSFAERMMIARIRHNKCLVRVSSGRAKMTANVIMYSNPTLKIYRKLPPSRNEMNEVLAFIFTGPSQPTDEDFKRCPMLVRRQKVKDALEWLKLNHRDYEDLEISQENLASYSLVDIPVTIDFRKTEMNSNRIPATMSLHDDEDEEGSSDGPCPFTVHGITGADYGNMSIQSLKARALRHLESEGKILGIGHDNVPQSLYNNPQAYPQMFPWLFPYGFGGIGQSPLKKKMSELEHKRQLLMYHDKRFQCDLYFPIVAFNHEQVKSGITGSFLVAKRRNFANISRRLMSLDTSVLSDITGRLVNGEHVKPTTPQEKNCFSILDDLDHIGGYVKGSITSKKYMRNEIWSLLAFLGAPSWFITLSPADNRHPISLYYASQDTIFRPEILSSSDRNRLTSINPVAAARFFHLIIELFIKHVLGINNETPGLYGETSAYYGTVEQQGRLTLHLHLLLWIKNAISPQEIRDRLMDDDSTFRLNLIAYLESVHRGDFITGTMQDVKEKIPYTRENVLGVHSILNEERLPAKKNESCESYKDPTLTVPEPAPLSCGSCKNQEKYCSLCIDNKNWWDKFNFTVDDIVLRSNVHRCTMGASINYAESRNHSETTAKRKIPKGPKGCLDRYGNCKARFPRDTYEKTIVDVNDGHLFLKKMESMLNTFTPVLSYLTRSNTDVTSLFSGTSIKAIISYISDYVSKPALKTYQIFSSMYDVFENTNKETDMEKDNTRRVLLKIVNSLSSKMEIGSPMASMYLLGNPDHYTSHKFVPFWWKNYVNDVQQYWVPIAEMKTKTNENENTVHIDNQTSDIADLITTGDVALEDNVILNRHEGRYVGINNIDDYKYRPGIYSNMSLFEWTQTAVHRKHTKKEIEKLTQGHHDVSSSIIGLEPVEINNTHAYTLDHNESGSEDIQNTYARTRKYMPFLDEHPLSATHLVKCDLDRIKTIVPNFVGSPLPRCDQGDRENYCCTMLTLFKPWRTGGDLKIDGQTWNDAYELYEFCDREKKIIKNFNLRYECLDARDDFHAELKKKQNLSRKRELHAGQFNRNDFEEDETNEFEDDETNDFVHQVLDDGVNEFEMPGPRYQREVNDKLEVRCIMNSSGWLKKIPYVENSSFNHFSPQVNLTHIGWASCIRAERDKIFKKKLTSYIPPNENIRKLPVSLHDDVRILSPDFLLRTYKAENRIHQEIVEASMCKFALNEEQERAFRIVANHASSLAPDQLKMYLGGMGGTGKSQVIKAVIDLFNKRNESHRFIVLAPTGTAAALLNGSTYHRTLGIISRSEAGINYSRNEGAIINEVRTRLQGVEYIFIDEVSMLSCRDLFVISQRLSQVFNKDTLFGGINMILAGDFAQLPPVFGHPFYSEYVCNKQSSAMKSHQQEATLGKIFWHQFTTVVILKQNMRQTTQSEEDTKLRTALENMRYAACTENDVVFLNTLVAKNLQSDVFTDPEFRNVSVITAWNSQKDEFNEQGSVRFEADSNQPLTDFYSIDTLGAQDENSPKTKRRQTGDLHTRRRKPRNMSANLQKALWDRTPCSSENIASKLSICVGMPVMIRNNDATELCITKGQEATVVGWDSSIGPFDKPVLDTLFIKLTNPPQEVNLPGLPTNIVPLTRVSTKIVCTLKSGLKISIQRQQVLVLPNFAMTDYSSQGKTRDKNVVHPSRCRNHQSYYTCLSRSSNAKGTILLAAPDTKKITKGISGNLRQEFRELHVLDEVTKLKYNGQLPDGILHSLRNPTVRSYYLWNKTASNEKSWHPALRYGCRENRLKDPQDDDTWILLETKNVKDCDKKDTEIIEEPVIIEKPEKSVKKMRRLSKEKSTIPKGFIWDPIDYSCAYDSLFTVLYNIWERDPAIWKRRLSDISGNLDLLCRGFERALNNDSTLEMARNDVRRTMSRCNPAYFPLGLAMTDISHVVDAIVPARPCGTLTLACETCNYSQANPLIYFGEYIGLTSTGRFHDNSEDVSLLSNVLGWQLNNRQIRSRKNCPECILRHESRRLDLSINFQRIPYLMIIEFSTPRYIIDWNLKYTANDILFQFKLAGIVYSGQNHFVCRVVDDAGTVWYNDGIATGGRCLKEGSLPEVAKRTAQLRFTEYSGQFKYALYAIYIRE